MDAKELLKRTEAGSINWLISRDKNTLITVGELTGFVVVVQKIPGQGCGRTIGCYDETYAMTFFGFGEGAGATEKNRHCPSNYDSSWPELPVMDLYDVVTDGKKRRRRPAHCCGASDFGVGLDGLNDVCPACEEERKKFAAGFGGH